VDIYLNGHRLDVRLEAERTVAEVAAALETWLAGAALCLIGLAVDGRDEPSSRWGAIAVEDAGRVDVSVEPLMEARMSALRTAGDFLRLFRAALALRDVRALGDMAPGYPFMVEALRTLLSPQPGDELYAHILSLDQLLAGNTPERIAAWSAETMAAASRAADGMAKAVSAALQEADDPRNALPRVRKALLDALGEIEQVSVLLQTGKDREAMARVISFSELGESLIGIVLRLVVAPGQKPTLEVAGRPLDTFQAELNTVLKQLLEAFTAHDTVLIGDLLEYEVAPRLRQLADASGILESHGAVPRGEGAAGDAR